MAKQRAVPVKIVSSWTELLDELYRESWDEEIRRHRSPFVYRGMGNANNELRTSLTRLAGGTDVARLEGHLLRNFKKYARADSAAGNSIWNWLALAAHHGLPTRLLDWTYSPFVALHFATADLSQYHRDAVVWCVDHGETNRRLPKAVAQSPRRGRLQCVQCGHAECGSTEPAGTGSAIGRIIHRVPRAAVPGRPHRHAICAVFLDLRCHLSQWVHGWRRIATCRAG